MTVSAQLIRKMDKLEPDLKDVLFTLIEDIENTVTKVEFNELKEVTQDLATKVGELAVSQKELAEAQKRTEIKVEELTVSQKELAEAQKRTEVKVEELAEAQKRTEVKVEELAEAQKRTEVKVEELAEAQKRTEVKMEELAEAQKRTEVKMEELAEAQKNTEISMQKLTKTQEDMKDHLAGLGFYLENEAYKYLPSLLKKDFNIEMKEELTRKHVKDRYDDYLEVNIIGKAIRGSEEIIIIGESKHRLSENKIKDFIKKRLHRFEGVFKETIFPVLVTHMISSHEVEDFAKDKGIKIYYSYQFR